MIAERTYKNYVGEAFNYEKPQTATSVNCSLQEGPRQAKEADHYYRIRKYQP